MLVNLRGVVNRHDNARPDTTVITSQILMVFGWEVLSHLRYFSDVVSTDLFYDFQNTFVRKFFDDVGTVKKAAKQFFGKNH